MLVDIVGVGLLLLFGYVGWRRGFLRSLLPLVGLAAAYAAGWLLHRPLGQVLGGAFSLQPLISYPLGGALAFVLTLVAFSLLGLALRRRRVSRPPRGRAVRLLDRGGGALLGAAYGGALVLLLTWALLALQAVAGRDAFGPDMRETYLGQAALPLVEGVARRVAGGETQNAVVAGAAARFARDPVQTTRDLTEVLGDRRVQKVLDDGKLMRAIAKDPARAAQSPTLRALARDPAFVERLQRVGLVTAPEVGALPPEEVQRQLAARLRPAARLATELARDPEVRALLEDKELQQLLERRDLLALANDPRFNRLAEIVVARLRAVSADGDGGAR